MNRARAYWLTCLFFMLSAGAHATTIVLPSDAQLVEKSPVIVDGTVVSSTAVEHEGRIFTETTIRVTRAIKGEVPPTLTVREIGGIVNGRITKIFGTAEFTSDERVLLFLEPHAGAYRTIDLFVGKFSERRTLDGQRLWMRDDGAGVTLLDRDLRPIERRNIQRDAVGFETFLEERVAGRDAGRTYGVENPILARNERTTTSLGRAITSDFTLIDEPTIYRWTRFDNGSSASWFSMGTQPGYSGGGVSELQTGMATWTSFGNAKILYSYSGTRTGTPGGLDAPNGANEVLFNDPLNEISGTFNPNTGGVVGTGGFNGVTNGGTWTAPFAADASHTAGAKSTFAITEGNLTIQDGVSPAAGISSARLAEIIAHEFGHTLGFGHSTDNTALMFPSVTGLGASLRSDDQLAARWLYPNGGGGPVDPPPNAPSAPSALSGVVSGTNIDLAWTDNSNNETGFSIFLAVGNGAFSKIGDVGPNVRSARVTGATTGTYKLYVVAFNASGSSAASNTITVTVSTAPVASFSFTPLSGTAGVTSFTFTDESTGGVTSRQWSLGDGATATGTTVSHVYTNPGTYTVTLTVSGGGQTAQTTKNVLVHVPLDAAFVFSPASPTPNDTIQFTDQSVGAPASWSWNFGDGSTSLDQNPAKKYPQTGTYLVTLSVSRPGGGSSSTTKSITVGTGVPVTPNVVAAFTLSPAAPVAGANATFTDTSSGNPTSWSWSFGDGGVSNAKSPTHVFAIPGTYTVSLTAANATSSATISKQITVVDVSAYRSLISVAAQTGGVGGTSWRTELTLFNAGAQGATVKVSYLPAGGGPAQTKSVFLSSHQSLTYTNALLELFAIPSGSGAMSVEATSAGANPDLRITSRTFTTGPTGTYGQSVPDVEPSALAKTLYVTGIKSGGAYRTNIGLVNRSSSAVTVTLTLLSPTGGTSVTNTTTLAANSFQQTSLAGLFPDVEGRTFDVLSLRIVSPVTDAVSAYASVVDNITQDPVYIQAVTPALGGALEIPIVGRAPGANGTFWRSDVTFLNPSTSRMLLTLRYGGALKELSVDGGETVILDDVLSDFGQTSGNAPLEVFWTAPAGPVVTSRTYTTVETGGTFGQSIDPLAQFANRSFVAGLRNDATYRTNIGILNGGDQTETFAVIALSASGTEIGRTNVTLAPGALTQAVVTALLPAVNGAFTLAVEGDSDAQLFAYGSMIDNRSGDPVFFAGR